jgi:hypothetical protein
MRRILIAALALALISVPVRAQQVSTTNIFVAYDHEVLTVSTSAIGFTSTKVTPTGVGYTAQFVTISIECATGTSCTSRFLNDGGTPTTSIGVPVDYQYTMAIYGYTNIKNFLAIRSGSTDTKYQVVYYR